MEIDKAKGIITNPRPSYWFNYRDNAPKDGDTTATAHHKEFNEQIAVQHKPYFMTYNYEAFRKEYTDFVKATEFKCYVQFGLTVADPMN